MQLYISTCAAMSTLAIWCRVVHSRDVSPYIFNGPAMSGLAFSVPPPFYHTVKTVWNSLPDELINSDSFDGFKRFLKTILFSRY